MITNLWMYFFEALCHTEPHRTLAANIWSWQPGAAPQDGNYANVMKAKWQQIDK